MEKEYVRIQWENRPSIATSLGKTNLNKMDYQIDKNENTLITFDTTKANQSDLLQTIRTLTYDTETGIFVFTFWNGSTYTVDLNIEKIPVTFSMDEYGVITMTTADGTTYTCDIGALIKLYTFVDGDEIDFVTTTDAGGNKTITASIKDGSIVGSKLQPNFLADCQAAKAQAELAATSASSDASDAELSSEDAEAWAVGERNGQPVPSTDPAYENNAKWWAQHGTGSSFAGLSDTNFTNLQNGQIAKYNSTTQKWENTEDEGGLLPHFKITSEAGSTVTVVCPDTSVITPTQTSSGIWQCDVPAYGVYTVHAVINGDDAVRTVTVDTVKEYVIHDEHYSYTLNVYAPTGSSIIVTDGDDETYTGTGAGSTAVVFALHQASTTYTIEVTYDGLERDTTITSSATTGGSGSKTIEFGTINLTLDEDLIGETIVMAKGTDTVSKVASSTSMVFYPNATGNWIISCQYDGETYYSEPNPVVVSSLSTPVSAEISLVHIPEGATVTPTDDIQTWLACANITNKSYTTLAEVLADRETFETLLRDSNACDYMARSTSWALAEKTNPTMTSNTTPSGTASASSIYSATYDAYQAFSENPETWVSSGTSNQWLIYEFDTSKIIKYIELAYSSGNGRWNGWQFKGSDNGVTWNTLYSDTVGPSATIEADTFSQYAISNNTAYKYYGIFIDSVQSAALSRMSCKAKFYEADITRNPDAMSLIGKYDYCSNALLGNAGWAEAIAESDYWESVCNISVPKMAGDTAPSGQVLYTTQYNATYAAYKVFDKDLSTNWAAAASDSYGTMRVGYRFTEPQVIKVVSIDCSTIATPIRVVGFRIVAKNASETEWTTLLTVTDRNTNAKEYYYLNNTNAYTDYNIIIDSAPSSPIDNSRISELQFYGRASSNVSNTNGIIHTAMGNDSVYCVETGDTYTATDGIVDIDFSDYEEGTYTFGSTTAKNPNDLTEDFKKRFRITKSPYGGTTELYLMPDTIDTLYWYGYEDDKIEDATNAGGWSGSKSAVYSAPTHNTNNIYCNSEGNYKFQGIATKNPIASANKICSVMLPTVGAPADPTQKGYLRDLSSKSYDNTLHYYNFATTSLEKGEVDVSNDSNFYIFNGEAWGAKGYIKALWYDRTSNDIPTFISAANDSLYIMDGNTKVYIANTNGEGKSYEPLLEAGTYTIYSSVAKDPNNLSNPYSKTVTVDESTQTIAVMPENTLYWWGYCGDNLESSLSANGWSGTASGTNITWQAPTYNVNSIYMNSSGNYVNQGVGTKNKESGATKIKAILKGETLGSSQSVYSSFGVKSEKSYNSGTGYGWVNPNTNTMQLWSIDSTATPSDEYYIVAWVGWGSKSTLYALWSE